MKNTYSSLFIVLRIIIWLLFWRHNFLLYPLPCMSNLSVFPAISLYHYDLCIFALHFTVIMYCKSKNWLLCNTRRKYTTLVENFNLSTYSILFVVSFIVILSFTLWIGRCTIWSSSSWSYFILQWTSI